MSQQQYATPYGGGMAVVTGPSSGFYQGLDASAYWGASGRYGAASPMVPPYTVQGPQQYAAYGAVAVSAPPGDMYNNHRTAAQLADNLAGSLQLGDPQPQAQQLQQRHVPQPPPPGGGYYAAAPWGAAAGPPPPPHQQQLPGYYNNRPVGYAGAQGQGWYPQQQQQQQRPPGPRQGDRPPRAGGPGRPDMMGPGYGPDPSDRGVRPGQGPGAPGGAGPPMDRKQQQRKRRVQKGLEDNVRRTVYISYIDQQVTEEMLATLFQECGTVMDCRICGDPNSAMRFAFVEFLEDHAAQQAVSLTGRILGKSPLRVLPSKTAIVPVNKELMPRSPQELERCSRTVYVANIDKKVEREDVRGFFEHLCGKVAKIRLLGDFAHSTRIAFVEFADAEGAMAALNCSGAMLGSLQLRVSPSKTPVRSDRDAERTGRGGGGGGGSSSAGGNGQAHKGAQLPDMLLSNREEAGAAGAGANSSNAPGYEASGGAAAAAAAPAVNGVAEVEPPAPEAQSLSPTSAPAVGGGLAEASGVGALAGVVAGAPGMVEGTGVQVQGVAPNPPAVHVGAPESPEGLLVATSPA